MVEDKKEDKVDNNDSKKSEDEKPKKKKLNLSKPKPIFYIIIVPAVLVFILYIVLNKIYLPKEELHEVKIQKVLEEKELEEKKELNNEDIENDEKVDIEENLLEEDDEENQITDENGVALFDVHNYYQFEAPFALNIKDSKKILTFDLAISTFQTSVTAGFFLENFAAFVPALRSEVLKELSKYNYEELKSSSNRPKLLNSLKGVINDKLEQLGSSPSIDKVFFVNYVLT